MRSRADDHRAALRSRAHRARARAASLVLIAIAACGDNLDGPGGNAPSPVEPTLLVVGRSGELATLGVEAPYPMRESRQLATRFASVRYHAGAFYAVQSQRVTVLGLRLETLDDIPLPGGDGRDIVFVDDRTAIASLGAAPALARIDLVTNVVTSIDLSPYGNGLVAGTLTACGSRVFVQLATPGVAVVDITPIGARLVDGDDRVTGLQPIPLKDEPAFAMSADCSGNTLTVAEPVPLMIGGGQYQQIDLATFAVTTPGIASGLGEVGGFIALTATEGWYIVHTEFGPSPSSHLQHITPAGQTSVWDVFAPTRIDHLAADAPTQQLFFPDGCTTDCQPDHATGVQVFDLATGAQLSTAGPIAVGFPPFDVAVAR